MEAKVGLCKSLKQQKILQDKLMDIEGRNRRNNIRIFGIPKDIEGDSAITYVQKLLTTEFSLPSDVSLQIQCAHRTLAQKSNHNSPPRSIIVNFLELSIKEMVLKKAWQKKIVVEGRQLIFDHDYATEVVQKRKEYSGIKKILKERGISFQTPLTRMRIHLVSGPKLNESAREAALDLRRQGLTVELPRPTTDLDTTLEGLQQGLTWQRVGWSDTTALGQRGGDGATKEKLQEFERIPQQ